MNLELMKELKEKTLEKIITKFGTGIGELSNMKLSIWDVRNILYEQANIIAKRELTEEYKNDIQKWCK